MDTFTYTLNVDASSSVFRDAPPSFSTFCVSTYACGALFCLILCCVSYDLVMGTCTVLEIAKYIGLAEETVPIELRYSQSKGFVSDGK
jgi:hypothetical protein